MIAGIDRSREIATVGRETVTLLANSLARGESAVPPGGTFFASRLPPEARAPA
jgi:alkanesulfonate monooxygenase